MNFSPLKLNLKKIILFCAFGSVLLSGCAPRPGSPLSYYPDFEHPEVHYPTVAFDAEAAKVALARGTGTIRGRVCLVGDTTEDTSSLRVSIYPVTPHLLAWKDLRSSLPKDSFVSMRPEVVAMRLDARTNADGVFEFTEMKPGKYFLQVGGTIYHTSTYDVYTGSGYSNTPYGTVTTNYYRKESQTSSKSGVLEEFIELKEGKTKSLTMTNKPYVIPCYFWW